MKRDCRDDDIIRTKFSLISVTKKQQIKKILIFLLFTFIDTLLKENNYNSVVLKENVINILSINWTPSKHPELVSF